MRDVRQGAPGRALAVLLALAATPAAAAGRADTPIRIYPANAVPACVTPERLDHFLLSRNPDLEPRLRNIARWYRRHGEAWRVRWDYAFFQMALETNFLTFRRADGGMGDVDPRQNNFAGLGTTGNGTPGDSFPDVSTGVLAHIQHLVVYSGQRIAEPVAPRTRLKQDDILAALARTAAQRPVTFQDLTGRWAVDRSYGRSIETIADRFRDLYCNGAPLETASAASTAFVPAAPRPAANARASAPAVALGPPSAAASTGACRVEAASFGGRKTLLIRTVANGEERFTALGVLEGFERSMADSFIRSHAPGGQPIAEFSSPEAALARAFELCPTAARQ